MFDGPMERNAFIDKVLGQEVNEIQKKNSVTRLGKKKI